LHHKGRVNRAFDEMGVNRPTAPSKKVQILGNIGLEPVETSKKSKKGKNSTLTASCVRINGPRAIYDNNERIKAHSFNAREKREIWPRRVLLQLRRVLLLLRRVLLLLSRVLQ
jgi:hypothetical protein